MSGSPKPVRRAFVFGGGGVLGFAWMVGALTAIQHDLGVEPRPEDLVVGTSAGSVAAGLLGCGVDIDTIRRHQLGMPLPGDPSISWNYQADTGGSLPRRPGLRPGSPRLVWDGIRRPSTVPPVVALSGLLPRGRGSLRPIHGMFESVLALSGSKSWPDRRTWIVATDYATGRRVVFGRPGEPSVTLPEAICSSCAIPAWYAPVQIQERSYIDGGTASNASVDPYSQGRVRRGVRTGPDGGVAAGQPTVAGRDGGAAGTSRHHQRDCGGRRCSARGGGPCHVADTGAG